MRATLEQVVASATALEPSPNGAFEDVPDRHSRVARARVEARQWPVGFSRALSRWATPEPPRRHRLRITDKIGVGPNLVELLQESSAAALAERLLPKLQLTTNGESFKLEDLATQVEALSDEEKDALLVSLNS